MNSYIETEDSKIDDVAVHMINVVAPQDPKEDKQKNGGNPWVATLAGNFLASFRPMRVGEKNIDYTTLVAEENTIKKENMPDYKRHSNYTNKEVKEMRKAETAEPTKDNNQ